MHNEIEFELIHKEKALQAELARAGRNQAELMERISEYVHSIPATLTWSDVLTLRTMNDRLEIVVSSMEVALEQRSRVR